MAHDHSFSSNPALRSSLGTSPEEIEVARAVIVRLPNAMVGREFSAVPADHLPDDEPAESLSNIPAGLEFADGVLRGTPEVSGEFEMAVGDAGKFLIALTVNADPRSLWKNLPSNREDPFWKADTAIDFLEDGPLTVVGASLRGRSHAHVGSFRDDDMALAWFPVSGWYSLTVADGAGSANLSRQGSKIACDAVKQHFADYFATAENVLSQRIADPEGLRAELCEQFGKATRLARQRIEEQATQLDVAVRDFHTTLITVLLHPLPDGQWFVAAFSIGDGAAALVSGGEPCLLTRPDGGEYAGQTVFLTMNEAIGTADAIMGRIQTAVVSQFDALLLVTDGISDPRFESESALADPAAWSALWSELAIPLAGTGTPEAAAAAILKWMEFHSPGHHDDRTLVLATPNLTFPPQ
ncbi:MAG: PP2C family serine/threonine-protein phosphatase [Verrucomicrobiota bacterium]